MESESPAGRGRAGTVLRAAAGLACAAIILVAALLVSDSTSGVLTFGLAPALLLDRYLFRLLPWRPVDFLREWRVRLGLVALAFAAALLFGKVRNGMVPLSQVVTYAVALTLLVFLLEAFVGAYARLLPRRSDPARWRRPCFVVLLLAALAPLIALHPPRTVAARGPDSLGLVFEEVRFRAADGVRLEGWLVPHPAARGSVIFCHGFGRNREQVLGLLPTLHELRLNVLAFDFRAHGTSGGHTATFGRREAGDLRAAEAFVRGRCLDKPVFIIGISYGAAVTLQALPEMPQVRAVWVEGCFDRFENVAANVLGPVPRPLRGGLVRYCCYLGRLDAGLWVPDVSPIDALVRTRVPIHFAHGTRDTLIPIGAGKALYDGYAGPKACFWAEGAGHRDVRRRHNGEYQRRLRAFFEAHLTAARE